MFCTWTFYLQETEQTKVVEVKTLRRGRSSRTTEEAEKDQHEKLDETSSRRGRRSGAAAKEATAGKRVKLDHWLLGVNMMHTFYYKKQN